MDNVLFEGDCLAILPTLPSASVDLILCDLPYGITDNRWDTVIDLAALWREYRRLIKPHGVIALTSTGVFTAQLIISNKDWFKYKLVWVKSNPTNFLNAKKQPLRKYEDICIFYQRQPIYNPQMTLGKPYKATASEERTVGNYNGLIRHNVKNNGLRYPLDVIYFKGAQSEIKRAIYHPTQKPVALARYLIRTYSQPGGLVLDNAFGSGSFLLAAHLENRRYCGIEKNAAVYSCRNKRIDCLSLAKERIEKEGGQPTVIKQPT